MGAARGSSSPFPPADYHSRTPTQPPGNTRTAHAVGRDEPQSAHQPPHEGGVVESSNPQSALLLVESDPDKQWRLARTLTVHGYRVVGTVSGEGALALMNEWPVDLVLISSRIRDEDGLEVAARLSRAHPGAPIALMADEVTPALEDAAHAIGAIGVLTRPPAVKDLQRLMVEARTETPIIIPAQ